jgi:DNA-binding Lrp family transcriptional regulator
MRTLDTTDLRILVALCAHPEATTVALAQSLELSRNTVQARLARLAAEDVFQSFDRRISLDALGHPLTAFVQLHVHQQQLASISSALLEIPEVVQAHGLTGSADVLVRVAARNAEDLFRIHTRMLAIDGVERADTSLAMAELVAWRTAPLVESLLPDAAPEHGPAH